MNEATEEFEGDIGCQDARDRAMELAFDRFEDLNA